MGRRHRRDGVSAILSRRNALKQSNRNISNASGQNDSGSEAPDDDHVDFFDNYSVALEDDNDDSLKFNDDINAELVDSDIVRRLTFDDDSGEESVSIEDPLATTKSEVPTYSGTDRAMIQIYQYALQQGTSLGFIDNLFCLIRKSLKEWGFDVSKAPLRKTFMKQLRKKWFMVHPSLLASKFHRVVLAYPSFLFLNNSRISCPPPNFNVPKILSLSTNLA
jgi:hypothetical protein